VKYLTGRQLTAHLKNPDLEMCYENLMLVKPTEINKCFKCKKECYRLVQNCAYPIQSRDWVWWGDDDEQVVCRECWDKI